MEIQYILSREQTAKQKTAEKEFHREREGVKSVPNQKNMSRKHSNTFKFEYGCTHWEKTCGENKTI